MPQRSLSITSIAQANSNEKELELADCNTNIDAGGGLNR
jgi:hypothetical protein